MTCDRCPHRDTRTYAVPVCTHPKAQPPIACVFVFDEQCLGKWR